MNAPKSFWPENISQHRDSEEISQKSGKIVGIKPFMSRNYTQADSWLVCSSKNIDK